MKEGSMYEKYLIEVYQAVKNTNNIFLGYCDIYGIYEL